MKKEDADYIGQLQQCTLEKLRGKLNHELVYNTNRELREAIIVHIQLLVTKEIQTELQSLNVSTSTISDSSKKLERLTWALIVLTVILAVLTGWVVLKPSTTAPPSSPSTVQTPVAPLPKTPSAPQPPLSVPKTHIPPTGSRGQ